MVQARDIVVVEADAAGNSDLYFRPLHRAVRGRLAFGRCPEPEAMKITLKWPRSEVPGQRIELNVGAGTTAATAAVRLTGRLPSCETEGDLADALRHFGVGDPIPPALAESGRAAYRRLMALLSDGGLRRPFAYDEKR